MDESSISRLERDYPEFAALSDWDKQMVVQGRVKLEDGGWSGQGEESPDFVPFSWLGISKLFPRGPLEPGWVPCDTKSQEECEEPSGGKCEPYERELPSLLWDLEEGEFGPDFVLSDLGRWAPELVVELANLNFINNAIYLLCVIIFNLDLNLEFKLLISPKIYFV